MNLGKDEDEEEQKEERPHPRPKPRAKVVPTTPLTSGPLANPKGEAESEAREELAYGSGEENESPRGKGLAKGGAKASAKGFSDLDPSSSGDESDEETRPLGNPTRSIPRPDLKHTIRQPVRVLRPADPPREERDVPESELTDRVDKLRNTYGVQLKEPDKVELTGVKKSTGVSIRGMGVPLSGFPSGGLGPRKDDHEHKTHLPKAADYTEVRPMQALSHISEVLYGAALRKNKAPVEVQAGHAVPRDRKLAADLFLSANDPATQGWMQNAMKNPLGLLHQMAAVRPDELPKDKATMAASVDRARKSALKILFNQEQDEERRKQIQEAYPGPKNYSKRRKLRRDLSEVKTIFENFLHGKVTVVHNPNEKHAEQNIAAAMYDRGDLYKKAEIGGTKIRCEGCSSELGPNLKDEEGVEVTGKGYAAQASAEKHQETMTKMMSHNLRIAMGASERPLSPSPLKAAEKGNPRPHPEVAKKGKKSKKASELGERTSSLTIPKLKKMKLNRNPNK